MELTYHIRSERVVSAYPITHLVVEYLQRKAEAEANTVSSPAAGKRTLVINAFADCPKCTVSEIVKRTGVSRGYTGEIIKSLRTVAA